MFLRATVIVIMWEPALVNGTRGIVCKWNRNMWQRAHRIHSSPGLDISAPHASQERLSLMAKSILSWRVQGKAPRHSHIECIAWHSAVGGRLCHSVLQRYGTRVLVEMDKAALPTRREFTRTV